MTEHDGEELPCFFHDLMADRVVSELIADWGTVSPKQWKDVEEKLPAAIERDISRVEANCSVSLSEVRQTYALSLPANEISENTVPTTTACTKMASTFFQGTYRVMETFKSLIYDYSRMEVSPDWYQSRAWALFLCRTAVLAAEALVNSLGFPPDVTMEYMMSFESAFVCQCPSCPMKDPCDWYSIVGHVASYHRDELSQLMDSGCPLASILPES